MSFVGIWVVGVLLSEGVLVRATVPALFERLLLSLVRLTGHGGLVGLELVARENDTVDGGLNTDLELNDVSSHDVVVVFLGKLSVSEYQALYSKIDLDSASNKIAYLR